VITSLARANALVVVPRHSEGVQAGEIVRARVLRPRSQIDRTLLAVGSHDVALDLLAGAVARSGIELVSANVGSIAGIVALAEGATHMAGTHVLDAPSGTYNVEAIKRYAPNMRVALVHFAMRQQGLIVAPGNPLQLHSIADVVRERARYVNRQKDAGTRMLLDALLAREGITPAQLTGYERLEFTHLAVAALVADGSADAGLGILAAARALGCDFIPVADEPYELAFRVDDLEDARIAAVIGELADSELHAAVERLGGYDMRAAGTVRMVEWKQT
jgi:putative molybdopterin biosynthesis protein